MVSLSVDTRRGNVFQLKVTLCNVLGKRFHFIRFFFHSRENTSIENETTFAIETFSNQKAHYYNIDNQE